MRRPTMVKDLAHLYQDSQVIILQIQATQKHQIGPKEEVGNV